MIVGQIYFDRMSNEGNCGGYKKYEFFVSTVRDNSQNQLETVRINFTRGRKDFWVNYDEVIEIRGLYD